MTEDKIQELQMIEQNLQNFLYQKQAFQMELTETEAALKELKSAGDETYKIIGNLMIKTDKEKVQEGLEVKHKMLLLRVKTLNDQESNLTDQADKLRKEVMENIKK